MTTTVLSIESGALAAPPLGAGGVRAYKGIPYAAPPVGPLRWRPPQPVAPWNGVRSAEAFGPNSLQGIVFDDIDRSFHTWINGPGPARPPVSRVRS